MNAPHPAQRYLGLGVLLAMAGLAAVGSFSVRRDIESLRVTGQDNILWTAAQMEVELLRFQLSVASLDAEATQEALEQVHERFDILWSRAFMEGEGRVGGLIARYDEGYGVIADLQDFLRELDPVIAGLAPEDGARLAPFRSALEAFRHDLRLYTLRVVRGDAAASARVRDRIKSSAQTTMIISIAAVLLSVLALMLILRENRRQREVVELSRAAAIEAQVSSRSKSRFLTMMSHEMRNPLNGVLGPLALLGQSDLPERQRRLVGQAQDAGRSMVRMLAGLLEYGEMQDCGFRLRVEPFRLSALAADVRAELAGGGGAGEVPVLLRPDVSEMLLGDIERLRHVFVNLTEYVTEGRERGAVEIVFRHDGAMLVGEIRLPRGEAALDWKLDLLMGMSDFAADQVSSEAFRPLVARGLIAAAQGMLSLIDTEDGRRAIRVSIPTESLRYERIRVRLETLSASLAAIYRAALRSDRIAFVGDEEGDDGPVDMVLVDATSVGEEALMSRLRRGHPDALFVSLGPPCRPDHFDDIVESPADMSGLRSRILGRIAVS